jgi:hypothetical protein
MSDAFSQSPPVYANTGASVHPPPHPINPTPMPMPSAGSTSYPYAQTTIPREVYRDSIQTAVLDKVRHRLDETIQIGNAQIDSLRRTEQDLINGEKNIQLLINEVFILFFRFIL